MADEAETIAETTETPSQEAAFWHEQLRLAGKAEEDWREQAKKLQRRYKDEKRSDGVRLNIFYANTEVLKPAVYSATPRPDVRRRNIHELPEARRIGRQAAMALERGLTYAIDDGRFGSAMESVRDDGLIVGRGVAREIYEFDNLRRTDIMTIDPLDKAGPRAAPASVGYIGRHPIAAERCRGCMMFRAPDSCSAVQGKINPGGHCVLFDPMPEGMPPLPAPPKTYLLDGEMVEPDFEAGAPYIDQKVNERVSTRYVFWADYRQSPSRCWDDVWWVAFRHAMTRDELRDEFGEIGARIPLVISSDPDSSAQNMPADPRSAFKRAEVWEIWNKRTHERLWIATTHPSVIRKDQDPLRLAGFFPMPKPLYTVPTTDSMVPTPEFMLYQDQADEIDDIQGRLQGLIKMARACGVVDADASEFLDLERAEDGTFVPMKRKDQMAGTLAEQLWWWPVERLVPVINELTRRAEMVKLQIYEITGITDLRRGSGTRERESATAQELKAGYGTLRMTPRSKPMAEFVRDLLRIKAEIMAEMFQPESLELQAGMMLEPAAIELLQNDKLRHTTVDIETDSTVADDVQAEKAEAMEFVTQVTQFLTAAAPIVQAAPTMAPLFMELLKASTKPFKFGRNVEDVLESTADKVAGLAAQAEAVQQTQMMTQPGMPPGNGAEQPPEMMQ